MAKLKTIGGKKYSLHSLHYTKKDAQNHQAMVKKLGYKTRLFTNNKLRWNSGELAPKYQVYKLKK